MNIHTEAIHPMASTPSEAAPDTGIGDHFKVAAALRKVLADTYVLTVKTHGCHWNIVGPLFYSVHNLTEEQYNDMFRACDVLAERMRALGVIAPMSMSEMLEEKSIKDTVGTLSASTLVADLVASHEELARKFKEIVALASDAADPVSEDLAVARSAFHEKAAWMLRSILAA